MLIYRFLCFIYFILRSFQAGGSFLSMSVHNGPIRSLGGYERLLSRTTPGSESLSLSHGSAFVLSQSFNHDSVVAAVILGLSRHPMLRAYTGKDSKQEESWFYCDGNLESLANNIVTTIPVDEKDFESEWRKRLNSSLNGVIFPTNGPLWRLENIISSSGSCSWVFTFNHAIDDQQSLNILVLDLLTVLKTNLYCEGGKSDTSSSINDESNTLGASLPFPPNIEVAVAPQLPSLSTLCWGLFQLYNSLRLPQMIPFHVIDVVQSRSAEAKAVTDPNARSTFCRLFELEPEELLSLRGECKKRGVTVTHALSAAVLAFTSCHIQGRMQRRREATTGTNSDEEVQLKSLVTRFLLSVSLRPYGHSSLTDSSTFSSPDNTVKQIKQSMSTSNDFAKGTVACASGAVDYVVTVPADASAAADAYAYADTGSDADAGAGSGAGAGVVAAQYPTINSGSQPVDSLDSFWELAEFCRDRADEIISSEKWNFVPESVRLFGWGMKLLDILRVVEMEAANPASLGRGYTCGVSNVGVVALPDIVQRGYYGTSHARNGVLCLLSCMTVNDRFCGCLQFTNPLTTEAEAETICQGIRRFLVSVAK